MPVIVQRTISAPAFQALAASGFPDWLARVFAARGIDARARLEGELDQLIPTGSLRGSAEAAHLLADAIARQKRLLIVADYDADGATACAVGVRALRAFGARVDYIVPDRFRYGYGLTPEIVQLAAQREPELLITVDNGISSVDGVAEANRRGIPVLVTDHHLPGPVLPDALCIVNPNQSGCDFPSKSLAGVGVMFYVMLALRAELRRRGAFGEGAGPNLGTLLDLVALGTVADVVRLDDNNRLLVRHGLRRIRQGRACAGIRALYAVTGRDPARASAYDLGFLLGPRLNAAGRLDDMSRGIACLTTDLPDEAERIARDLDRLNRERREIEAGMQAQALTILDGVDPGERLGIVLFDPGWHQGVIGILASRIKDRYHRPVIALARGTEGELKGSGRSIPGLHLRDALERVDTRHPGMLLRFGGHAAAAGLTVREADRDAFTASFESVLGELLSPADLKRQLETDGELDTALIDLPLAQRISDEVWGQGFPEPCFTGEFGVHEQRVVGTGHLKLRLSSGGRLLEAMLFGQADPLPPRIRAAYRIGVNEYNGNRSVQLTLVHWEPA